MKKAFVLLIVMVFSFVHAFNFVGCSGAEATQREVRACWVSSVGNLDFPTAKGLSEASLKKEIDTIVYNCKQIGLNTIFFQVRPMGDALYSSEVFPWSVYLSGQQGMAPENEFDPLDYFIKKAHTAGIELHAWINPYRIGTGTAVWEKLSRDNPAVIHPEYTITSSTGVFYDPGQPEVRRLIVSGVTEIVKKYDVDGIHFDDYFYPYDLNGFDDENTYLKYGNGMSLGDFRRNSVDQLIKTVYTTIKTLNKNVSFGVSPFGIWANQSVHPQGSQTSGLSSYSEIYSDSKKWVEEGWLDYICPQIYWSFENKAAPFATLVDWWSDLCSGNKVDLYVGAALYRVGSNEAGWAEGTVMEKQLRYASKKNGYAGHCFFRYGCLLDNKKGALDSILNYYGVKTMPSLINGSVSQQISVEYKEPQASSALTISSPSGGSVVYGSSVSVCGTTKPGRAVTVNGVPATVSSKGFYSAYVPLKMGKNTVSVVSDGEKKSITVSRKSVDAKKNSAFLESFGPNGAVYCGASDVIEFGMEYLPGATILLSNGVISVSLEADDNNPSVYSCQWTAPLFAVEEKLVLKDFSIIIKDARGTTSYPIDLELYLYSDGYTEKRCLIKESYIYDNWEGGSQMDNDPLSQGGVVHIVQKLGNRALLDNGFWVDCANLSNDDVKLSDTLNYSYDIVTIAASESFCYSTKYLAGNLSIHLSKGRNVRFEIESEQADLMVDIKQGITDSEVVLSYRSGKKIIGYEVLSQSGKITVYVRSLTNELAGKTIMLDAGHGGEDDGALGPGGSQYPSESDLNLVLTAALKKALEANGATVLLTRNSDKTVTLAERVECAARYSPDVFVSLHYNSVSVTENYNTVSGGLMLYSSPVAEELAKTIAKNLWNGVGKEASVSSRRQSLYVCRQTRFPSVLVETGFMCNPLEYEKMCDMDIAEKIANNIVIGLRDYFVTVCS